MATLTQNGKPEVHGPVVSNDAEHLIELSLPYTVRFTIEGIAPILFHRWSNESVAAKSAATKGSAAKKTDDVESYVWRNDRGHLCLPGEYIRASICGPQGAAKFHQDPRSPRKSALDLYRAAIAPLTLLAPMLNAKGKQTKEWDYLDARRVTVQRSGITRQRPAFNAGWRANFEFQIGLPEYISHQDFLAVLSLAGRVVGVADFRPTYGRFQVTSYEVIL